MILEVGIEGLQIFFVDVSQTAQRDRRPLSHVRFTVNVGVALGPSWPTETLIID